MVFIGIVGLWWVLPLQLRLGIWVVKGAWRGAQSIANGLVTGVGRGGAAVAGAWQGDRGQLDQGAWGVLMALSCEFGGEMLAGFGGLVSRSIGLCVAIKVAVPQ